MKHGFLFFLLNFNLFFVAGQVSSQIGARQVGLGNVGATLSDVVAVKNNPGAFGFFEGTAVNLQYANRFLLNELATQNISFGHQTEAGNVGVFIQQSGFQLFRQIQIGGTYAMQLSNRIGMGVNLNYHSTRFGDIYGKTQNVSASVGVNYKLNKKVQFGASVLNINRAKISDFQNERLPTLFILGGQFQLSNQIIWLIDLEKDLSQKLNIKSGLEINANAVFDIRFGINTYPFQSAFGVGINLNKFTIDIASVWHAQIGLTPTIGLTYAFK
ncbi:hypothetical protein DNU06_00945 [Putridiphycobacter roseus]|uniref:PorV/PorQ family protein n=1 Tax=Putridiphycobacter roseus TaxID=2219161 RepID=A0A2W1NS10_9FLAO|nr:hypothetical protein [Putridiphycobacter roseus]PZE18432.1 hypothetical protein DNU06_00945 [Putridiphycobacter roseus]